MPTRPRPQASLQTSLRRGGALLVASLLAVLSAACSVTAPEEPPPSVENEDVMPRPEEGAAGADQTAPAPAPAGQGEEGEPEASSPPGFTSVGEGVGYARSRGGDDAFVVYGGYGAREDWVRGWALALSSAKLEAAGFGHVYAVRGPRDVSYTAREIANSALGEHLRRLRNVRRLVLIAHSSGAFVANELLQQLADKGALGAGSSFAGGASIAYLDGGGTVPAAAHEGLRRALFVYADDPRSPAKRSANAAYMIGAGARYPFGTDFEVDATGSGCSSAWCLHDAVVIAKPYDPTRYDLARDYTLFTPTRPVVTSYLDALLR